VGKQRKSSRALHQDTPQTSRASSHKTGASVVLFALLVTASFFLSSRVYAQPLPPGPAAAPSGLRLVGTVKSKAFSGAVLVDAAGMQSFYRLNDRLPDESQIVKVLNDSILLKRADNMYYELFITGDTNTAIQATSQKSDIMNEQEKRPPQSGVDERRSPRRGRVQKSAADD
jgi:hypothetical protein